MYLKELSVINFKNISSEQISLCDGVNCFVGDNGTCKTNLMDAVHFLSMCKSSLQMTDGQCVMHGQKSFMLEGVYEFSSGRTHQICCAFTRGGQKVIKRNGKPYDRMSDHVGMIPVVMVSPQDSSLVSDAAEERRRYLNSFLAQIDREYLCAAMRYNAVLQERNRYLKSASDETMLLIYDQQLSAAASKIFDARSQIVQQMIPLVQHYYSLLSQDREAVDLSYRSELSEAPLSELLLSARQKDIICQFTTSGVHRDDLLFSIGGFPLRRYGSQGQQKSFLVALKLAQYRIIAERTGEKPIMLLDDVFDKLDRDRVTQLIKIVSGPDFGQIFITDCNLQRMEDVLSHTQSDRIIFNVEPGRIVR